MALRLEVHVCFNVSIEYHVLKTAIFYKLLVHKQATPCLGAIRINAVACCRVNTLEMMANLENEQLRDGDNKTDCVSVRVRYTRSLPQIKSLLT